MPTKRSLTIISLSLILGFTIAAAGSVGGDLYKGVPVLFGCAIFAFAIQSLMFVHAYIKQTEHYYDLTGGITYISVTLFALYATSTLDLRSLILGGAIIIWSLRLAGFLFLRIKKDGSDSRFDEIKPDFLRFLGTWLLQGLWVVMTAGCALSAITSANKVPFDLMAALGLLVWGVGFAFESVADWQKRQFRAQQKTRNTFITTGLWAYSRHPNYFGEILLWFGMALIAYPVLDGWQYVTLISPLFVYVLLTKVSGINMLEESADKRWGDNPDYLRYKENTPELFPKLP